ncbi:hypothetical protein [Mucilaginibacter sp. 10B2]|uniref:hypothetical protein n=1 Tax=Mucilaginibacter sp. 10B2 TaxID=3048574 RepID=UPI002B224CC3|nr:hypothetical protein [Mucilaginibacter sp. 10B2]MEB0278969.1 hypothetical protein [Mucilaginibacter sp. 10B2]
MQLTPDSLLDTLKIGGGGVVAATTLAPAVSPHDSVITIILHYALPLIYTLGTHLILNLFKPKTNANPIP